ncbi:nucleotidyltransferase domain-containing protein [Cohnella soli]|uniref:Nucleotidyltransferase domain-containing protein n=1 Tax=Cohnella soli TaxID=425005 RepID=A0ABW0HVA7_9BACL
MNDAGRMEETLAKLAELLEGSGARWVVGGSTGLALRGAKLGRAPRDVDLYADANDVRAIHERLSEFALDAPAEDETDKYRSILSHYHIGGTVVELVGQFRVAARNSVYKTEVSEFLYPMGHEVRIAGKNVVLVPLAHELVFNLLRDRVDRVEMVGALITADSRLHVTQLEKLLARNHISEEVTAAARTYAARDERNGAKGAAIADEQDENGNVSAGRD